MHSLGYLRLCCARGRISVDVASACAHSACPLAMTGWGRPVLCGLECGDPYSNSTVEIIKQDDDSQACPVCGFQNRSDAKFCSECGAKTRQEELDGTLMREPLLKGRKVLEETEPPPEDVLAETEPPEPPAEEEFDPIVVSMDNCRKVAAGTSPEAALATGASAKSLVSAASVNLESSKSARLVIKPGKTAEDIFGTVPLGEGERIEGDATLEHQPLEIVFWFHGTEQTRTFLRRPLGMSWRLRAPITIDKVRKGGHADELGVQVGWQIKEIAGTDVSGYVYKKISKVLGQRLEYLPWSQSDGLDASQSIATGRSMMSMV